jgi:5-methylcytosine-specific restriction endonuclease McrA
MSDVCWWDRPQRSWYQLERWRKIRRRQLAVEPFCAMCAANGLAVPATVADHVKPHNGDWQMFLYGKLQSLCKSCHDSDKRYIDLHGHARYEFGVDGWPVGEGSL